MQIKKTRESIIEISRPVIIIVVIGITEPESHNHTIVSSSLA